MAHTYPEKVGIAVVALIIATLITIQYRPFELLGFPPADWAGWAAAGVGAFMLTADIALYEPQPKRHGLVYFQRAMHGLVLVTGLLLVYRFFLPDQYDYRQIALVLFIIAGVALFATGTTHGHKRRRNRRETPIEAL